MTAALMVAACAITYGAIAYLTPITYISILQNELDKKSQALIAALEQVTPEEGKALLADFARGNGAALTAWDEHGNMLYESTLSGESSYAAGGAAESTEVKKTVSSGDTTAGSDGAQMDGAASFAMEGTSYIAEDTLTAGTSSTGGMYNFTFADGTAATMNISGGIRAVNQAAEALGRVLPFLIGVILLISLAGSFFYARLITRPIVAISRIAHRMAELDFKARWEKRRGDEIGSLGDSLNLLSGNLSDALCRLKDANQALQHDIDRERELDKQRLAFFSAVSHELKTPITILRGQLSGMLAQVGIYRDREKYLARALEVTGRMEGLVKEILTVSRIESGSFSLKAKPVDLAVIIRKQLDLDGELIEQRGLTVETRMRDDSIIQGDEPLLTKVLDNVLLNAILYSPPGASILVEVGGRTFSIENTGASIPQESLAQLFTPFYRVEQSRSRKSGGSGLGLYLVKTILSRHSASCGIENTSQGVRFFARFP
jgi:two-component system sensor histidine kinase VanS